MTGQYLPYASGTDEMPGLGMRLLENAPGITASIGFSSRRGSNTMLSGGYLRGDNKFGRPKTARDFVGSSSRRGAAMASGETPFVKRAFANNNPLNPRNMFKYSDMSVFAGQGSGMYTPFAASGFLGERKFVKNTLGMSDEAGSVLGPGLLSAISAGSRADRMERKALARQNKGKNVGRRLERRLAKADRGIKSLTAMNNQGALVDQMSQVRGTGNAAGYSQYQVRAGNTISYGNKTYKGGQFLPKTFNPASPYAQATAARGVPGAMTANQVGARGNMMASSLSGIGTQKAAGFVRGAMGYAKAGGFTSTYAREGAERAVSLFDEALKAKGFAGSGISGQKVLEQGIFKSGAGRALLTKQGAQVGAARALGFALPGLQVVAAASFMYDVGKMAGTAVKGSIDLAKDSIKSMQGSLYKPMFGMGYNDTEAAATSRARGVMAIQNSRLNARSMLGSEAGMMAAHFG